MISKMILKLQNMKETQLFSVTTPKNVYRLTDVYNNVGISISLFSFSLKLNIKYTEGLNIKYCSIKKMFSI